MVDNISTKEEGDSEIIDDSDYGYSTTTQSDQSQTMTMPLSADDTPKSPVSPSSIAPDPPQWRFVRNAKKTEGYSSDYAGSYVKGMCYISALKMVHLLFAIHLWYILT